MTAVTVGDRSRVRLHQLRERRHGDSWIVGRVETGDFIELPEVGRRALALLPHATVGEVRERLREETGADVDIADFVTSLIEVGFVAEADGRVLAGTTGPPPMFPRLRPHHVRWLVRPAASLLAGVFLLAALVAAVVDPSLAPRSHDVVWMDGSSGLLLLGTVAMVWSTIFVHELAHLLTARAAGAPGRMSLGTRLQFLVAQTDVSGVWAAPRRVRLTVYLAGIATNLLIWAGTVLVRAAGADGAAARPLAAAGLLSLTLIPAQFLVFMRTDLYFVLQDLAGCADLYADGSAYLRHLAGRPVRRLRRAAPREDPSVHLAARERRAIRAYAVILVAGTVACLAVEVLVMLPLAATVLTTAVHTMAGGAPAAQMFDAAAAVLAGAAFAVLWSRAWWQRHGHRVRGLINRVRHRGGRWIL